MQTNQSPSTETSTQEPLKTQAAPLKRPVKTKSKTQLRAEQKLLAERQAWNIDVIIAGQAAAPESTKSNTAELDWALLLTAPGKPTVGSWLGLDKALTPFCMGAPGPMNPKTGQYVMEIKVVRGQAEQIDQVVAGIHALLPFLKPMRGTHEFRIKCLSAKYKEKNWLVLNKDGKAQVLSTVHPAAVFEDLRSAIAFISEHRPASENLQ